MHNCVLLSEVRDNIFNSSATHRTGDSNMAHYERVIPRDLFNEANLLKCYGKLWINTEKLNNPKLSVEHTDGNDFDIHMNPVDGSLSIHNVILTINDEAQCLFRPLNSREAWPLWLLTDENLELEVYDENGEFSTEFLEYVNSK